MSKVRPEAFLWGAGTALGELPPYFMAKASRLSGFDPEDDDDLKEFEELKKKRESGADLSLLDRAKVSMERVVERIGFLGILACASVSKPKLVLFPNNIHNRFYSFLDSKSIVRFGRHHLRSFSGSILDVLRSHTDWQSCD